MENIRYQDVQITYVINSALGLMENSRYSQEIKGEIELKTEYGKRGKIIGHVSINRLLVELGLKDKFPPIEIFDIESHVEEACSAIFEFDDASWVPAIEEHYKGTLIGQNILLVSRFELIPKYRGHGFGPYLIKDIYNNFIDGMALFVVKAFPIQFEYGILESAKEFTLSMDYYNMEKNEEKATCRIISFYEKIGFEMIPAVSTEFMFINPTMKNERLDKIILE